MRESTVQRVNRLHLCSGLHFIGRCLGRQHDFMLLNDALRILLALVPVNAGLPILDQSFRSHNRLENQSAASNIQRCIFKVFQILSTGLQHSPGTALQGNVPLFLKAGTVYIGDVDSVGHVQLGEGAGTEVMDIAAADDHHAETGHLGADAVIVILVRAGIKPLIQQSNGIHNAAMENGIKKVQFITFANTGLISFMPIVREFIYHIKGICVQFNIIVYRHRLFVAGCICNRTCHIIIIIGQIFQPVIGNQNIRVQQANMGNLSVFQESLDYHIVAATESQVFLRANKEAPAALLPKLLKVFLRGLGVFLCGAVINNTDFICYICFCTQQRIQGIF